MDENGKISSVTVEADNGAKPETGIQPKPKRRNSRRNRWLLWIGAVVVLLVAAVGGTVAILLHRAEPLLRASVIDALEKKFQSRVELDDLRVSILDGFWVEGRGLRIWLPAEPVAETATPAQEPIWRSEPWVVVNKFRFHTGWRILPTKPIEISVAHIEGVRILLPPKEDRPHWNVSSGSNAGDTLANPQSPQTNPQTEPSAGSSLFKLPRIEVRKIECVDAQLVMERNPQPEKPTRIPLDFELRKIILTPDSTTGKFAFTVDMINAKPIGDIHSTGNLGPWVAGDPGELPVEGDYRFDHADLGTIKGIAGILSSTGHYTGTLRRIEADGDTRTPDFRLERAGKEAGLPLQTHFHAIVDGTSGNTSLQPVDAILGHTHFVAQGQVVRASDLIEGAHGHDIQLRVTEDRGHIEDILHIAADAQPPFMTGNLTFQTSFHLPPNTSNASISVLDRLLLDGEFHLSDSRFNSSKMQGKIEQLSLRGQGKPGELKTTDPMDVLSDVHGHFKLGNGILQLPDLEYEVPGAKILAHGTYGLQGGTLSFEGDAKMDASLSQMVGGWKGFLLKPADRYLRKNGAGTDVPIHVSGSRKNPEFGIEFDRLGKTQDSKQP
jgi:hypothetical protein